MLIGGKPEKTIRLGPLQNIWYFCVVSLITPSHSSRYFTHLYIKKVVLLKMFIRARRDVEKVLLVCMLKAGSSKNEFIQNIEDLRRFKLGSI